MGGNKTGTGAKHKKREYRPLANFKIKEGGEGLWKKQN